jgi:hypothetical protein
LVVILGCVLGLVVTPAYNFGQREHLFAILALPYFLAAVLEPIGLSLPSRERLALGLYAVFGIALKPFFLLPRPRSSLRCAVCALAIGAPFWIPPTSQLRPAVPSI